MAESARHRKIQALLDVGQSVWLDYLHRDMTRSGELRALIADGLRGMTSNPTIFERALSSSASYDVDLAKVTAATSTDRELFETLEIADVGEAADLFRPVYDATDGRDGFVSIEVSPAVARDGEGAAAEARRLWKALDRPNVMIKIPGMREGWPAIEQCLREGININITLLFSVEHYRAVSDAYLRALETRSERGQSLDRVASVASFFLSRIDTEVDNRIGTDGSSMLHVRGRVAIAAARLAYEAFLETTRSARWRALEAKGARKQRLLWASTGTKNPAYSDVLYVESLIAPDTISTVPPDTLRRFADHGVVAPTLEHIDAADAKAVMDTLVLGGVDFATVNQVLEDQGIAAFDQSFDKLLRAIAVKRRSAHVTA